MNAVHFASSPFLIWLILALPACESAPPTVAPKRPRIVSAPPRIAYPGSRQSTRFIATPGGVSVPVDRGIEWQGITVFLAITSDLVAVDSKTDRTLWAENVSAFWNRMTFKEVETEPGCTVWAVELRANARDDPDQKLVEYHDLATGKKLDIPGLTPPPLGTRIKSREWTSHCAVAKPFYALVSTPENYDKVWHRLYGPSDEIIRNELLDDLFSQYPPHPGDGLARVVVEPQPPPVDFAREVLIVFCNGDGANTSGIRGVETWEDERRILLRTHTDGFQTMNHCVFTRHYAMFVLPRRVDKAYVLDHDEQQYIAGPPVWKERFRVSRIGDADHEMDAMPAPAPRPPPRLTPGFQRDVKHATEDGYKLGLGDGQCGYDYYLDADGRKVLHGPFQKLHGGGIPFTVDSDSDGTVTVRPSQDKVTSPLIYFSGLYVDGERDGLWTHWARPWQEWDNRHPHYTETWRRGVRDGPVRVFNKDGALKASGQFKDDQADGVWMDYHPNGTPAHERAFEHGLLEGVSTVYDEAGNKIEELHYRKGQLHGPYSRWYSTSQVALTGAFVAADEPLPESAWSIPALNVPGLRHGEWVRYGTDGKQLWRGAFDRGTGTVAEFYDDGSRWFVAQMVIGLPAGEFRQWHKDGWLEKTERFDNVGGIEAVAYYDNGVKRSEATWRRSPSGLALQRSVRSMTRQRHGVERYWDRDGNLEAECEWRDGRPWSGDCLSEYNGAITRYANGEQTKEPMRYTREEHEKQEFRKKIDERRARRGLKVGYGESFPFVKAEDEEADRAAGALIGQLRAGPEAARATAADALAAMGPPAVPALTARLYDRDLALGAALRKVLARIAGKPGAAEDGMAISALPAGPRPQPGEAVPVWLTLTNTGSEDLYVLAHLWTLEVTPPGSIGPCIIFTGGPDPGWEPLDYIKLTPGETWSGLMDADANGFHDTMCAALNISRPPDAVPKAPGKLHAMRQNMFSGDFKLAYVTDRPDPDWAAETFRLADSKTARETEKKLVAAGAAAVPALRVGLRAREHWVRWAVFDFICRHPRADLEDDIVAFWGRLCNGWTTGDPAKRLLRFAVGLPQERRLLFLERIAAASPQDWRTIIGFVFRLSSGTPEQKACGFRFDTALYERGYREYSHLNFMAWQRVRGEFPDQRDLRLGVRLARECVADKADYADGWHTLAVALMESGKTNEALDAAARAVRLKKDPAYEATLAEIRGKLDRPPAPDGK